MNPNYTREDNIGHCCCLVLWVPSMFGIRVLLHDLDEMQFYTTFCCISYCSSVIGKEFAKYYVKIND